MPKEMERGESTPIEKREIRGLTFEAIIKYGSIVVLMISGSYLLKGNMDKNTARIEFLEIENEKKDKKLEAQELKIAAFLIWQARIDEKLNK